VSLIFDIVGGLVSVGMQAYKTAQASEAEALAMLEQALVASAAKVKAAIAELDAARAAADAKIAAGWQGDK
jgi:hypothetical protein